MVLGGFAAPAGAAGIGNGQNGSFGASPKQRHGVAPRAYFSFTLSAGASTHDALVVSNTSKSSETLKLGAARGVTAGGSGDAYTGAFGPCSGPACWISGLPATVTIAGGGQKTIPFTVTVPAGTALRQYLAGISVRPAKQPAPTQLGSKGGASAQAVIVHEVDVGVAVTVGKLSQLSSRLVVKSVTTTAIGSLVRLLVQERNLGQTFLHAKGTAVCTAKGEQQHVYPVVSDTVLPGDNAVLPVNAAGLTGKTAQCRVQLGYGSGSTAAWSGAVALPQIKPVKIVHTGPGIYSTLPVSKGIPIWAIALIAIGGALVLLLVVVALLLLRRRRPAAG